MFFMYHYTVIIDGLIGSNSIAEIKCPYSVKDSDTLQQALQEKKVLKNKFCWYNILIVKYKIQINSLYEYLSWKLCEY